MIERAALIAGVLVAAAAAAYADAPAAAADGQPAAGNTVRAEPVRGARRVHAGLELGIDVPVADLSPGLLIGAIGELALDPSARWLVHVSADWVRTEHRSDTLLTPAPFPRSRAALDDRSDLVTLQVGGSARLVTHGALDLRAALSAGAQISRARFEAYAMTQVKRDLAPAATLELSVGLRTGPATLRGILGYRVARRNLDSAGSYGEETTSGAIVALRGDW